MFRRGDPQQKAEKLIARGKIEAAIKQLRRVLKSSPGDIATLNRVGDLYSRLHRYDEAIKLYQEIADTYTVESKYGKAVAVYKKIHRLDPTRLEVYEQLADLYYRQGLVNDSQKQYEVLADYYLKHNDVRSAIHIYLRMLELEPKSVTTRESLMRLYEQSGDRTDAARHALELALLLVAKDEDDEALTTLERGVALREGDMTFVVDAVNALEESGHADVASRFLERAEKGTAARGEAQAPAATTVALSADDIVPPAATEEETDREEASFGDLVAAADRHEAQGAPAGRGRAAGEDEEPAPAVPQLIAPPDEMLEEIGDDLGDDAAQGEEADGEVDADESEGAESWLSSGWLNPPSNRKQARAGQKPAATSSLWDEAAPSASAGASELLSEAETLSKYGLHDKALDRFREALELQPEDLSVHEKLVKLLLQQNAWARAKEAANAMSIIAHQRDTFDGWERVREKMAREGFVFQGERVIAAPGEEVPYASLKELAQEGEPVEEPVLADLDDEEIASALGGEASTPRAAPQVGPAAAADRPEPAGGSRDEPVEEVVDAFRKKVAATLAPGDHDTHFQLGVAYREMGLLDEAIGALENAVESPHRAVEACSLLGVCWREKGEPERALEWYERGCTQPDLSTAQELGFLYDLAATYESLGRDEDARQTLEKVCARDSSYRDVASRLERLS